jgi:hypothetical protein
MSSTTKTITITTPEAPTESAKLRRQLESTQSRAQQIEAQRDAAAQKLETARAALVDGTGTTAELTSAQSEFDALQSAFVLIGKRIEDKRAAIGSAQATEQRAAQLDQARDQAERFLSLRAEIQSDVPRLLALLEAEVSGLISRIDSAEVLALDFARTVETIENPPEVFEMPDGQKVSVKAIENQGTRAMLAALYRQDEAARHDVKAIFEAILRAGQARQQAQWRANFEARQLAGAEAVTAEQIAANVARSREPGKVLNAEEARQLDAQRVKGFADHYAHIGAGRARDEARHAGDTMAETIDREAQELQAAAERRARAEMEAVGA